mgnify:CR=1 FL=1
MRTGSEAIERRAAEDLHELGGGNARRAVAEPDRLDLVLVVDGRNRARRRQADDRAARVAAAQLRGIGRGRDLGGRHRAFAEVAEAHGVSSQQVALAWELAKAPVVIPIPGSSRPETITDSAAATRLRLSDDELARLDQV